MAPSAEVVSELSRLKKEYLVDIIVNKKVPHGITISSELRDFVEDFGAHTIGQKEPEIDPNPLHDDVVELNLRHNIKVLETELFYSKRIIGDLE